MARAVKDSLLLANVACPVAANVVNTAGIDLGTTQPFPTDERFDVNVRMTAATSANTKNINVVLQGSTDNGNWTNIADLSNHVFASNAATTFPASSSAWKLPPGFAKRYIRVSAAGETNGGNSSDGTLTLELLF